MLVSLYLNKNVGKPFYVDDAWHVDLPKFGRRGAPMVVSIGGVRQGMSELLHAIYTSCKVYVAVLPQF